MKLERNIDVLVLGYYGFGNLGDELLSKAVVDNLTDAGVEKDRIVLLSANPELSEKNCGVKAYNRWNLGTVSALMKQSKSFLLGGGGLFQDVSSVKSCGYYWWMVRGAKISKTSVWAVSQSVGPLQSRLGKWFTKNAFKNCSYISVRDEKSQKILSEWNIKSVTTPDLVLGNKIDKAAAKGNCLLLNLRPCYDEAAVLAIRQANFIAKRDKLKIIGVALAREDQVYLENIEAKGDIKLKETVLVEKTDDFNALLQNATCAVGMRLHFAELCMLAQLPLSISAYDPKVEAFCENWNIPQLSEKMSDSFGVVKTDKLKGIAEKITDEFRAGLNTVLTAAND